MNQAASAMSRAGDKITELEQQLAQIKAYKGERPSHRLYIEGRGPFYSCEVVHPLLDQRDQQIAALRLDIAQKDARIAELEGGK